MWGPPHTPEIFYQFDYLPYQMGRGSVHILLGTFAKRFNVGVVCMKFEVWTNKPDALDVEVLWTGLVLHKDVVAHVRGEQHSLWWQQPVYEGGGPVYVKTKCTFQRHINPKTQNQNECRHLKNQSSLTHPGVLSPTLHPSIHPRSDTSLK